MNIMMEEEPYVRPVKTMADKIAEIPYEDELLIGPCYDKEHEELIFDPSNENQSEQHVKELMEACPNLDREKALLWLSEFPIAKAIRLAKKLCFPVLIPTYTVPGLSQLSTQMSRSDLAQVLAVRVKPGIEAVLPGRVYVIPDAKFQQDIGKSFIMGFDERRYVNAPGAPSRRPVADSEDDEEDVIPPTPKMKKKKNIVKKKSTDNKKNKNKKQEKKEKTPSVVVVKKIEKTSAMKIEKAKDSATTKKIKKTKEPKAGTSGKKPSTSASSKTAKTKKKTPSETKKTATVTPNNQMKNVKPKKQTARRVLARCQETSEPMEE
ncbi:hypothetical protein GCK72_004295 [Caenorhabditis remanei]|uniref:Uncharacterized protein n=1 Tax=Caenorhabditis remanei TaxID=31234 RepID=A0A6A5H9D5_CAERE|nr:hypothetical protein GCK72_004295 [Caenorhabditis remanei]KAF1764348.1 hypothetical protein GCK72_004295 [Caenorhabditis remanei]